MDYLKSTKRAPLRPIVSTVGAQTYAVARLSAGSLTPFVGKCMHHGKNSAYFIISISGITVISTDLLDSFDVVSLFTRVPLSDTLELLKLPFSIEMVNFFDMALTSS